MCYDMAFATEIETIYDYLPALQGMEQAEINFEATYHKTGHSYPNWPIVLFETGPVLVKGEWGVIANYMDTPEKITQQRKYMLNARAEKILDPMAHWYKIRHQRCLIPVTGYFEHREVPGFSKKVPYYIKVKDRELTFIAGLWSYSPVPNPETGEVRITFTVITRSANDLLMKIHNSGDHPNRMPHVLPIKLQQEWLDPTLNDAGIARVLNYQAPSVALEAWPVDTVRRSKPDEPAVISRKEYSNLPEL
jgi:putative SOS response-associated peptidase YedK